MVMWDDLSDLAKSEIIICRSWQSIDIVFIMSMIPSFLMEDKKALEGITNFYHNWENFQGISLFLYIFS